jgi:hypothetical protein
MKRIKCLLLLIYCFSFTYSIGQNIKTPEIQLPNLQFDALYNTNKITNPVYLNGKVSTVKRTFTQHISPYSEEFFVENFNYILNKNKEVIDYSSDFEFDETTSQSFNEATVFKTNNDTIIQSGYTKYVFKKGLLTLKENRDLYEGSFDSIVYRYKNSKLKSEMHYISRGMYEMGENGEVDESEMIFEAFNTKYYVNIVYNKKGLIESYENFEANQDIVSTKEITNNYNNNGSLKSYTVSSDYFYAGAVDVYTHPDDWVFNKDFSAENSLLVTNGLYNYDTQGRIVFHEFKNSKNESDTYHVIYSKTGYLIKVSRDYHNNYEEMVHQDLEYEYIVDALKNPIQVNSYIIENGERLLDKSTVLEITYFED